MLRSAWVSVSDRERHISTSRIQAMQSDVSGFYFFAVGYSGTVILHDLKQCRYDQENAGRSGIFRQWDSHLSPQSSAPVAEETDTMPRNPTLLRTHGRKAPVSG